MFGTCLTEIFEMIFDGTKLKKLLKVEYSPYQAFRLTLIGRKLQDEGKQLNVC